MQPENQPPNGQTGQTAPYDAGQGFMSIAHTQSVPQVRPEVEVAQTYTLSPPTPTMDTGVTPAAYEPPAQVYATNQPPQATTMQQPMAYDVSPTPATSAPPQQYQAYAPPPPPADVPLQSPVAMSYMTAPPIASASYVEPPRPSRRKFIIIAAGFLVCFIAGTAVGLFVPLPGVRPANPIGGSQLRSSSLLAPINFQYTILGDNTAIFLTWSRVEGASSYTVEYAKDQAFTKDVQKKENIKDDSMTLREVKYGDIYYFRVIAHNGNESSGPSGVITVELID